jgi:hypothetical protein
MRFIAKWLKGDAFVQSSLENCTFLENMTKNQVKRGRYIWASQSLEKGAIFSSCHNSKKGLILIRPFSHTGIHFDTKCPHSAGKKQAFFGTSRDISARTIECSQCIAGGPCSARPVKSVAFCFIASITYVTACARVSVFRPPRLCVVNMVNVAGVWFDWSRPYAHEDDRETVVKVCSIPAGQYTYMATMPALALIYSPAPGRHLSYNHTVLSIILPLYTVFSVANYVGHLAEYPHCVATVLRQCHTLPVCPYTYMKHEQKLRHIHLTKTISY